MIEVIIYKGKECLYHNTINVASGLEAVRIMSNANNIPLKNLRKVSKADYDLGRDLGSYVAKTYDKVTNRKGHYILSRDLGTFANN